MPDIVRRIGSTPAQRGSQSGQNCPDIFELADGRYAVIGILLTPSETAALNLPDDASVAPYEGVVIVSRDTMLDARPDLPED